MKPCLISTRTPSQEYPQIKYQGRVVPEARAVWMQAHGPIPDGMRVCHHCDTPRCIELEHFFLGTDKDNHQDRSRKGRHANQKKTRCPKGHLYSPENTYRNKYGRRCKICVYENHKRWRARNPGRG